MFPRVPFSSSSSGPGRKGFCSLPVGRDNGSVLSYLCSHHLTGQSPVGFGKPGAIVLQLRRCKANKWHHSLLPPDPGRDARWGQPHVLLSLGKLCPVLHSGSSLLCLPASWIWGLDSGFAPGLCHGWCLVPRATPGAACPGLVFPQAELSAFRFSPPRSLFSRHALAIKPAGGNFCEAVTVPASRAHYLRALTRAAPGPNALPAQSRCWKADVQTALARTM